MRKRNEELGKRMKNEKEQVSVIIPVYNAEKYLKRCVESVRNQTYSNLQIILVDDGSKDFSCAICDEYKEKDPRIHVVHKSNGGPAEARNSRLDIATGEYICFIDSDDYIASHMIAKLYEKATDYEADMSICGFECVKESENSMESKDIYAPFCNELVEDKEIAFDRLLRNYGVYYTVV